MSLAHRIEGTKKIRLRDFDPGSTGGVTKEEGLARAEELGLELADLQDILYYAGMNGLLVLLQGRDTAGKDGTIREILRFSNSQSCRVEPFKQPTEVEIRHDFLWRVHARAPKHGDTVIFNRSHYEDVLVARVHGLVPRSVWRARYAHINAFESLLGENGTILLKFYLHISKQEQERRLLDREKNPEKAWKLSVGDWKERELWSDYTRAYEDALNACATPAAPWFLVPADHKWFRNVAVLERVVAALRPYRQVWLDSLTEVGRKATRELRAYRRRR